MCLHTRRVNKRFLSKSHVSRVGEEKKKKLLKRDDYITSDRTLLHFEHSATVMHPVESIRSLLPVTLCYCIVIMLTIKVTINMKASTFTWATQIVCDSTQSEDYGSVER